MIATINSKLMETIFEFSVDGIYIVDGNGFTIFVSKAYEHITGLSRHELIGVHMRDLEITGYLNKSVSLLVLEKKEKITLIQKIKQEKNIIVTGNPVFDENGNIEMVITTVRDVTELYALQTELNKAKTFSEIQNYRFSFAGDDEEYKFIFKSNQMDQIFERITQISIFPTSILLTGPSGVGKEVIANLIHHLSDRNDKPFIKVNCSAIPETLLESEFFGYEPGAFTGARREGKIGLLELANHGTIMLDEIGEMPIHLQVKLLRVLQEKKIRRIGGTESRQLDIRIISATNQDLSALIKDGKFREDLYYRIAVVEISIPPLHQRHEDIEVLVEHYFSYYCKKFRIHKEMSPAVIECLKRYDWPGNVRELKNIMENIVVSVLERVIEPYHLPFQVQHSSDQFPMQLKNRLEQVEKQIVKDAIMNYSSIRQAAKHLGVDHSTLVKKIKKWNLTDR